MPDNVQRVEQSSFDLRKVMESQAPAEAVQPQNPKQEKPTPRKKLYKGMKTETVRMTRTWSFESDV